MNVMAFQEKAGWSQVDSFLVFVKQSLFSRRVATVAMLPSAFSRSDSFRSVHVNDTLVRFNYLPTLRAQIALSRSQPSQAIEVLQASVPYEFGTAEAYGFPQALLPVYVLGEAYLAGHRGPEAVTEFQKVLDHPGIVFNEPTCALAYLQLGRAYVLSGEDTKARSAYQDFLTIWKDADPDVPILKVARAEYAKLK
jgi:hypothetical protein